MNEVRISVVVPQRAWIFISGASKYGNWSRPWPLCRGSGAHEDTLSRCRKKYVKPPIVKPDRRRPGSLCIAIAAIHVVSPVDIESWKDMSQDAPVHQIMRFKHGDAGHEVKAGGDQVIAFANPNHIGIGIVRE